MKKPLQRAVRDVHLFMICCLVDERDYGTNSIALFALAHCIYINLAILIELVDCIEQGILVEVFFLEDGTEALLTEGFGI